VPVVSRVARREHAMTRIVPSSRLVGVVLHLAVTAGCSASNEPSRLTVTSWVRQLGGKGDELVVDVASRSDGSTLVLTQIGSGPPWAANSPPEALGLVRLDRSGIVVSSQEFLNPERAEITRTSIAVTPVGDVLLAMFVDSASGCVDLGAGPICGSALLKLDPTGPVKWQRPLSGTLASAVAADSNGGAAIAITSDDGAARLRRYAPDGAEIWEVTAPRLSGASHLGRFPANVQSAADGGVLFARGLAFHKFDSDGNLLWSSELAADARVSGSITVRSGDEVSIFAATTFCGGTIEYAGVRFESPIGCASALAIAGADGSPRLLVLLGGDPTAVHDAAPDGSGLVSILTTRGPCSQTVETWNSAGARVREHDVGSCDVGSGFVAGTIATNPSERLIVVGGGFAGNVDLGTGLLTSRQADGFVIGIQE
jgi:hypothetical protein